MALAHPPAYGTIPAQQSKEVGNTGLGSATRRAGAFRCGLTSKEQMHRKRVGNGQRSSHP